MRISGTPALGGVYPMHDTEPGSPRPRRTRAAELYGQMKPLLLFIAASKFRVPFDESEALVHDVFESYLRRQPVVANDRAWFVGAICNACRHYWRKHGRYVALEEARDDDLTCEPTVMTRLTAEALVATLSPRDRRIISLRFDDGRTIREVAHVLGISASRTEKLLRRALRRLAEGDRSPLPADSEEIHRLPARLDAPFQDAHPRHREPLAFPISQRGDSRCNAFTRFDAFEVRLLGRGNTPNQPAVRASKSFPLASRGPTGPARATDFLRLPNRLRDRLSVVAA